MPARLISDLKILVNDTHVLQLLEDKPLTLLGKAPDFLMGHFLKEISYRFGQSYCYHGTFRFHALIIGVYFGLSIVTHI